VSRVGGAQDLGPLLPLGGGQALVDVVRVIRPSGPWRCAVLYQGEEPLAEGLGVLVGPEPIPEVGAVLERLELGLGEGVGIGDVRPGVRGHHAQGSPAAGPRAARSSITRIIPEIRTCSVEHRGPNGCTPGPWLAAHPEIQFHVTPKGTSWRRGSGSSDVSRFGVARSTPCAR
jgi:hypothetical protein